jgi:hypothetical protein
LSRCRCWRGSANLRGKMTSRCAMATCSGDIT